MRDYLRITAKCAIYKENKLNIYMEIIYTKRLVTVVYKSLPNLTLLQLCSVFYSLAQCDKN